jgi:hypothetical protein
VILELFGFDTHGQLLFIPLSSSLCDCELFHSFYDKPISITDTVCVPFCDECPIIIKFFWHWPFSYDVFFGKTNFMTKCHRTCNNTHEIGDSVIFVMKVS